MVNQRLWDMEDAEGSKEKFLWQVSLTQRGTQGKICTKLRTWRRACCMRLQILLGWFYRGAIFIAVIFWIWILDLNFSLVHSSLFFWPQTYYVYSYCR